MSLNRHKTPLATLAATLALSVITIQCGRAGSPAEPTTTETISRVALSSPSVAVGASVQGVVSLTSAASAGGSGVTLSSSNPTVAAVQTAVTVEAGSLSAAFTVTAMSAGTATVTAAINGTTQSSTLTVTRGQGLSSISLNAGSVIGGNPVTGTLTLSSAASATGAVVSLFAGDPVTVPGTVTIAANATTATFTMNTRAVEATIAATISGSYGGESASAILSVTPVVSTSAIAHFGVRGTDTTGTCRLTAQGGRLECTFDGSTSTAAGAIVAWEWSYTVSTTMTQTTTGPVLLMPVANCGLLPPPPLPAGTTSLPLTVTLRVRDSLGNVSAEAIDRGARVLPQGACGF